MLKRDLARQSIGCGLCFAESFWTGDKFIFFRGRLNKPNNSRALTREALSAIIQYYTTMAWLLYDVRQYYCNIPQQTTTIGGNLISIYYDFIIFVKLCSRFSSLEGLWNGYRA